MDAGRWVLLVALVVAVAIAGWRTVSNGRFRGTHRVRSGAVVSTGSTDGDEGSADDGDGRSVLQGTAYDGERGERATLLQFSSAFCAPCRATRRTLADVAERVPGVTHVEVDAESNLELVRRLGIFRTPTTLVLDGDGREVTRASGPPRAVQVLSALEQTM